MVLLTLFHPAQELEPLANPARFNMVVLQQTDERIDQGRSTIGAIAGLATPGVKAEQDDWDARGSVQALARANRRAGMAPLSQIIKNKCYRAASTRCQAVTDDARSLNPM